MDAMNTKITYRPLTLADRELVADWVSGETWPYHGNARVTRDQVLAVFDAGDYVGEETQGFWIMQDDERIGILRIEELKESAPSFDLRLRRDARGRGIGVEALRWLTNHTFQTWPHFERIEGCTREDNLAMQRVFKKAGYVKEGHFRAAWPVPGAAALDSIRYGMLRSDWERGITTPVRWEIGQ